MVIVLRCADVEISKAFYEKQGLLFRQEKHGTGPVHYTATHGEWVFELYPARPHIGSEPGAMALSFEGDVTRPTLILDPDGRRVLLVPK